MLSLDFPQETTDFSRRRNGVPRLQSGEYRVRIAYMQSTVTLRLKLIGTQEDFALLAETQSAYVQALNHTSQVAFTQHIKNPVALHHLTYRDVRAATGLPANLTCSARAIVAEAYKREPEKKHAWKENAGMRYDARTLTLRLSQAAATLTTLQKRVQVGLVISDYHRQYLDGIWTIAKTATLCRSGKRWFLHVVAEKEIADVPEGDALGVDAGIKRVATTSTGKIFPGGTISQIRRRRFRQRRSLKAGHNRSRGKRRLLKRLAKREQRAVAWKLWNVANGIVHEARATAASVIVLECLTGIRFRIRVAKKRRLIQHGWPFASLAAKIRHVASKHGIHVEEVDARNTSRTCRCGHVDKANRLSQSVFRCVSCGYSHNADILGAFNIRERYVNPGWGLVNAPVMPAVPVPVAEEAAGQSRLL